MPGGTRDSIDGTLTTRHTGAEGGADAALPLPEPRPGDRIGRYVVEGVLGTGGMGMVVAAHDPELARQVAVKLVRRDAGDRAYRQRLVREARAMAKLEHDNVVRVYDAGEHDGEVFVAMELVRGETVGRWMRAAPRPWREVLLRFAAAGRGLAAAHRAGLVHRDFKPDNVLVRAADGRVCVTDFGLAVPARGDELPGVAPDAAIDATPDAAADAAVAATPPFATPAPASASSAYATTVDLRASAGAGLAQGTPRPAAPAAPTALTRTGMTVGTPAYMAPEQHRGDEVDARSDVFSFCVSLYEGLYGERPFAPPGGRHAAWADAIRGRVSPPLGRQVPSALRRVVLRGLAADPADRWPDMDTLLAQLARAERPRGRWAIGLAVIALVAVGLGVVLALRRGEPAPPAAYADGLRLLRRDEFHGAAAAFERATREVPGFAPAWVGLARAREAEPDLPRARVALATALRLIPASDRARRLEVEGLGAELDESWDTAIDRYQAYVRFFPADVDVGLALADAQVRGGHFKESAATVQSLRAVSDDVRLALADAKAAEVVSDWSRSIAAASRAIEVGTAMAAPDIVARASLRRAAARSKLHQRDAALADLTAAGIAARQAGDRALEARQFNVLTRVLRDNDDLTGAARAAEQAVAIDREIGEPHNLASDLLNAAAAYSEIGDVDHARPLYQEAFTVLRPLDDRLGLINALLGYGQLLTDIGDRALADKPLRESVGLSRAAGAEPQVLVALGAIAWNDFGLGSLKQAEAEWREAATLALKLADTSSVVDAYNGMAMALTAQGDAAGALHAQEQAVRLAEQVDPTVLARERGWYAIALIGAGQHARAPELALAAADFLRDHQVVREELIARAAAACALAELGRRADAQGQLALVRKLLEGKLALAARAKAAILLMRAAARLGDREAARGFAGSVPRDRIPVPWAQELTAQARRLGVAL